MERERLPEGLSDHSIFRKKKKDAVWRLAGSHTAPGSRLTDRSGMPLEHHLEGFA
ncbi:hypothetical protein [Desmospora profundinema]|uniref:Uncharacterized protein n=1 Tax=Desmospora profundinema TaxID=1571184 RepID=A0ABU1IJ51_9BACL|nr:hypothetical protein [Desmospora profundinema]MDR6224806.1 hypothetical protein [Desmospora profundinema]